MNSCFLKSRDLNLFAADMIRPAITPSYFEYCSLQTKSYIILNLSSDSFVHLFNCIPVRNQGEIWKDSTNWNRLRIDSKFDSRYSLASPENSIPQNCCLHEMHIQQSISVRHTTRNQNRDRGLVVRANEPDKAADREVSPSSCQTTQIRQTAMCRSR